MAPRFGFDDGTKLGFDATLVLATLLISQLKDANASGHPHAVPVPQGSDVRRSCSQSRHARAAGPSTSEHPSDHTKIWSDLSGDYNIMQFFYENMYSTTDYLMQDQVQEALTIAELGRHLWKKIQICIRLIFVRLK